MPGAGERRSLLRSKRDTSFVLCDGATDSNACGLIQSSSSTVLEPMPPSGTSRVTRSSLRAAATEALEMISGRDCAALDIGCSDGTLLSYYPRWVERFGVDTDPIVDSVGDWAWTACSEFPSPEVDRALGKKKFDIISAISVLEKVDEPKAFLAKAKSLLSPDGILVIEVLYAPMMLTRLGVGEIANGSTAFYSLGVLERLLRDCDMKIFRGGVTEKSGGSIRIFATHSTVDDYDFDPWFERLAQLWDEENALSLRTLQPYHVFEARAEAAREQFEDLMAANLRSGASIHILGADRSAELIYAWAGKGQAAIEAVIGFPGADERKRIGSNGPPIVSEAEAREAEPDALIVPLAMKREALEVWREQVMRGMKLIIMEALPTVVTAYNYDVELSKSLNEPNAAGDTKTLRSILSAAGGLRLVSDRSGDMKEAG